jgi:uncharacterized protein (TIGR03084 family)
MDRGRCGPAPGPVRGLVIASLAGDEAVFAAASAGRVDALATTRLAEHWTHAQDIAGPLGIAYPDSARLRHIAWLGHRTLPYAFAIEGIDGGPVYCELTAPGGEIWDFGDPAAPSVITGPAAEFCRVGARRLGPGDSTLTEARRRLS